MTYHLRPLSSADVSQFQEIVGAQHVVTTEKDLAAFGKDWTKMPSKPGLAILPANTNEVAAVLAYCHQHQLGVVPSGGQTGLAGGAVAQHGEVVISLRRMNRILNVDTIGLSLEVEAGVVTESIQRAALDHQLFYGVDLAAKGSCQIGGNIATNAGGLKLIRFGGTREQVLGLEVVLADGTILDMNANLVKNNTGYDLKHLFIGSEGTLGIITKATLRLTQKPKNMQVACLSARSFVDITEVLRLANQQGIRPTAFEFFTERAMKFVLDKNSNIKNPFAESYPFYILFECENEQTDEASLIEQLVATGIEQGYVQDAVLATTSTEFKALWSLRELISESVAMSGHVAKNDISLPIHTLPAFTKDLESLLKKNANAQIQMALFGHIGDGNLHLNYVGDSSLVRETFFAQVHHIQDQVFALCQKYNGSVSAEHGIGLLKVNDLKYSRSPLEISFMKDIKKIFDPKGILNPGKIFALSS